MGIKRLLGRFFLDNEKRSTEVIDKLGDYDHAEVEKAKQRSKYGRDRVRRWHERSERR